METLSFMAVYMLPSMIAWYRRKQGKPISGSFRSLVFYNFFLGWTIVVWFLSLAEAFGYNPIARVVLKLVNHLPSSGPVANVPRDGSPGAVSRPCGQCGRTGKMPCSSCNARGSWYDPPQGASGTAQLRTCPACVASGKVICTSCGGTGLAQALIG